MARRCAATTSATPRACLRWTLSCSSGRCRSRYQRRGRPTRFVVARDVLATQSCAILWGCPPATAAAGTNCAHSRASPLPFLSLQLVLSPHLYPPSITGADHEHNLADEECAGPSRGRLGARLAARHAHGTPHTAHPFLRPRPFRLATPPPLHWQGQMEVGPVLGLEEHGTGQDVVGALPPRT